jgi:peroxiredoxin (alkyl hydroperoxide reductase subunit C)
MSLVGKSSYCSRRHLRNGWQLENKYFEEAINNNKKVVLFGIQRLYICMSNWTSRFSRCFTGIWKKKYNRNWLLAYNEVHFAWLNTAKNNGIEGVTYPILADRNLSNILGILDIESTEYKETDSVMVEGSNVTYRATYLIETGKIFHESKWHAIRS